MKLLVTGAAGLLGSEFAIRGRARGHAVVGLDREALDVTDVVAADRVLSGGSFDWVVHCAGYTAVDRAEAESDLCRAINVDGTANVARAAVRARAGMVYISTDYVFDGRKTTPYRIDDATDPISVYGRTKLDGERAVRTAFETTAMGSSTGTGAGGPAHLIVRTGWLYGEDGRGFVRSILERAERREPLEIVSDQVGRPTYSRHVAEGVLDLLELVSTDVRPLAGGVWHVADGGQASWHELAREALRVTGTKAEIVAATSESFGAAARRPAYSVLDLRPTEAALGRRMPEWREVLAEVLAGWR